MSYPGDQKPGERWHLDPVSKTGRTERVDDADPDEGAVRLDETGVPHLTRDNHSTKRNHSTERDEGDDAVRDDPAGR